MVASVGRISAGRSYDYLTKEVATSQHDYYTGRGEAAGVWSGRGLAALGLSGEVDATVMDHLYGRFVDPRTAGSDHEVVLGRKVSERIVHKGTTREKVLKPVAAFDVTFSPSKSVSALFAAVTDARVRAQVIEAHEAAVAAGLDYLEDNAGHARGGQKGIRRVDTDGFIIAQFRHRTARSTEPGVRVGDPQLHSHCAILNRLHSADGKWRTLDGAAIYRHTHAAGVYYGTVLERELTARLGVSWVEPDDGARLPMREIAGIPESVRKQWSSRREQVMAWSERMEDEFLRTEHRSPTGVEKGQIRDRATVLSRAPKSGGDVDLHDYWRSDLTADEIAAVDSVVNQVRPDAVTGGRLAAGSELLATAALQSLEAQRSWWTRAHLFAEVARLSDDPSRESIEMDVERIAGACVVLESDDDDAYAQLDSQKMTSPRIIAAENFVLDEASKDAPWTIKARPAKHLGDDQVAAVEALTSGNHQVATVIGPAGAGKTTLMQSVAKSYKKAGREIAVFALAANAAQVVTQETGIPATTIATWRVGGADLPRNGLLLVDEASMVPTLTLRDLCRTAAFYNTRVGLVGDYAQMGSPEAGGLLRDLGGLESATLMTAVRRFKSGWAGEGDASKRLRTRDAEVAELYALEGRINPTTSDSQIDDVTSAWFADRLDGVETLVVVDTNELAADVSAACQQRLVDAGRVGQQLGVGSDHNPIRVGDLLQTRANTSDMHTTDNRRVLNREVWKVGGLSDDGRIIATNVRNNRRVALNPNYLSNHVVLAYATTLAGAQGRTVDRGHVLVTPRTDASSLYVGMSRGRENNQAHVVTDGHDHDEFLLGEREPTAAFADAIRRNPGGELSATTVSGQWRAGEAERHAARSDDKMRALAMQSWMKACRVLPRSIQSQIDVTETQITDVLLTVPSSTWIPTIRAAARSNDWNRPDANERFLATIAQPTKTTNTRSRDAAAQRTPTRER